jgi:hypothetical protein
MASARRCTSSQVSSSNGRRHVDSAVVLLLARLEVLLDELPPSQWADDGVRGEMGRRLEG